MIDARNDAGVKLADVACGCGDYKVWVPTNGPGLESIDVVCPECGNHFGVGAAAGEPCPCRHDHEQQEADS